MDTRYRRRVGLALGGGVLRGIAHVGVLSVLVEAGIPIDYVAGSSSGAIIGAAYCLGVPIDEMLRRAKSFRWWKALRPVWPARGLFSFDGLADWLIKQQGDLHFSDLKLPFVVMTTDLGAGAPHPIFEGRLAPAIQASCSVPGVIAPVEMDGRLLVDGAISCSLPVPVLRQMGAEYVIGVDIFAPKIRRFLGPLGYGLAAFEVLVERAGSGVRLADCLIRPALSGKSYVRISQAHTLYELGRLGAMEKLDDIRQALDVEAEFQPTSFDAPFFAALPA